VNAGHYISGIGHAGLIGWLLFGGSFAPAPDPFEVSEVSVISGEEFDAMMARSDAPDTTTEVSGPGKPPATEMSPDVSAATDTPPEAVQPEETATAAPDPAPDTSQLTPPVQAEVDDTPPVMEQPSEQVAALVPEVSARPQPRPVQRVAPEAVAAPEPDTTIDDVVREAAKPAEPAAEPVEEQQKTAPEEAATEIVPEAAEKPSAAPTKSVRPKTRPAAKPAAAKPADTPKANTNDAVADALKEAMGGNEKPARAPSGPPMTGGEKEALRVAVSACWNVGSLSSDALKTTVVVSVQMNEDGKPDTGSIRMLSFSGGSAGAAEQAFGAARRAIIRCQKTGYNLPKEKYDHWREIEMTFNPEKMRIK